ncbi:hypothetical protein BDW71DRAFT_200604 [Aspergillus fruticulosus]
MTSVDTDSGSETLRIIEDPGRGFLGNLTPWFLVNTVDDETFTAEFLEAEEPPFSRWCAYDRTLKLLLINLPTRLPRDRSNEWPTIVLEVVYIETESKLQSDPGFAIERCHDRRQKLVVITRTGSNKITITGAPLRNIGIDNGKLEFLATRVWSKQRF